ncbi:hypothetical protein COT70_00815 [candidate division WWE3 bacterium CG09_land_8_20_14_0_10_47_33]|uniref:Uncharacterized protein n=1 Tax=candidate division WWE3 bacterium CG_4_9_14_0_2_um_filter_48_10 TaxID=1975078 RepID=A0A2M8EI35_UNCKA|nr:MAG: hypothetical protein COT70_00815 [candidate division WWE3 bacterium CG09_land_8_20_14_0_10_47_33]PIZ41342.1 MAG: hypothetical protein COY35_00610 [candidate division WWE3 bacterium CG_4_10_14_0_2_um_filter_47_8]PJC22178.1 MAG: hypothetical protein CO059_02730 [candidate division WWE3 bacterium CG_4_9_14_0_2_um_filter_48_10]PJE51421.1 MAG: hypothetical protein COV28_02365 [candidate division WWE3 bacterium CG10_big_fil_rev_8_21_14_0_10_48_23]
MSTTAETLTIISLLIFFRKEGRGWLCAVHKVDQRRPAAKDFACFAVLKLNNRNSPGTLSVVRQRRAAKKF